jgi:hypothetical protein
MFDAEDETNMLQKASYAAYDEALRAAYRALSSSITDYFEENPELYAKEALGVPRNFRPLREYERTLKIQKLTLQLAIRTSKLRECDVPDSAELKVYTDGKGPFPVAQASPER